MGLCDGNPFTGRSPHKGSVLRKAFLCDHAIKYQPSLSDGLPFQEKNTASHLGCISATTSNGCGDGR